MIGSGIGDLCGATNVAGAPDGRGYRLTDGTATVGAYGSNQAAPAFVDENGAGVCDCYGGYGQKRTMGRLGVLLFAGD